MIDQDERTFVETLFTTMEATKIARASSILSAVSSLVIITIILRSSERFSIMYHRLIFGISALDTMTSVAMALATLPMPRDMIYTQFKGTYIGTELTCEIQASVINGGTLLTLFFNVALCRYYHKSLTHSWATENGRIRNRIEPALYVVCTVYIIFATCIVSLGAGVTHLLNPSPYVPWCTNVIYPYWCTIDDTECIISREVQAITPYFRRVGILVYFILFAVGDIFVIGSLVFIANHIFKQQKAKEGNVSSSDEDDNEDNRDDEELSITSSQRSGYYLFTVVCLQAIAYIFALLLSHSSVSLNYFMVTETSNAAQIYFAIARPIQGFFNMIVFVSDKTYKYRFANRDSNVFHALCQVLFFPLKKEFVFSDIYMVEFGRICSTTRSNRSGGSHQSHREALDEMDIFPVSSPLADRQMKLQYAAKPFCSTDNSDEGDSYSSLSRGGSITTGDMQLGDDENSGSVYYQGLRKVTASETADRPSVDLSTLVNDDKSVTEDFDNNNLFFLYDIAEEGSIEEEESIKSPRTQNNAL